MCMCPKAIGPCSSPMAADGQDWVWAVWHCPPAECTHARLCSSGIPAAERRAVDAPTTNPIATTRDTPFIFIETSVHLRFQLQLWADMALPKALSISRQELDQSDQG